MGPEKNIYKEIAVTWDIIGNMRYEGKWKKGYKVLISLYLWWHWKQDIEGPGVAPCAFDSVNVQQGRIQMS